MEAARPRSLILAFALTAAVAACGPEPSETAGSRITSSTATSTTTANPANGDDPVSGVSSVPTVDAFASAILESPHYSLASYVLPDGPATFETGSIGLVSGAVESARIGPPTAQVVGLEQDVERQPGDFVTVPVRLTVRVSGIKGDVAAVRGEVIEVDIPIWFGAATDAEAASERLTGIAGAAVPGTHILVAVRDVRSGIVVINGIGAVIAADGDGSSPTLVGQGSGPSLWGIENLSRIEEDLGVA